MTPRHVLQAVILTLIIFEVISQMLPHFISQAPPAREIQVLLTFSPKKQLGF